MDHRIVSRGRAWSRPRIETLTVGEILEAVGPAQGDHCSGSSASTQVSVLYAPGGGPRR
jgi:hypothetical protein